MIIIKKELVKKVEVQQINVIILEVKSEFYYGGVTGGVINK